MAPLTRAPRRYRFWVGCASARSAPRTRTRAGSPPRAARSAGATTTRASLATAPTSWTRTQRSAVGGGHVFRQIGVGGDFTCAVTTGDRAFCWETAAGAIGNGRAYLSFWPRKVAGGLSIGRVSAGGQSACAETLSNQAYCWGTNSAGQLGDGNPPVTQALEPVAVAGGHAFAQLSAGNRHVCGQDSRRRGLVLGRRHLGIAGPCDPGRNGAPLAGAGRGSELRLSGRLRPRRTSRRARARCAALGLLDVRTAQRGAKRSSVGCGILSLGVCSVMPDASRDVRPRIPRIIGKARVRRRMSARDDPVLSLTFIRRRTARTV